MSIYDDAREVQMFGQVLTKDTLPVAVANLFRMNNYECEENIQVRGSQIDVVAKARGNPFAPNIYIEVTVSYVDNIKYALDLTKFVVVQKEDPSCICLCISLEGFTAPVKERAGISNIKTQTYEELFKSFENFHPYINKIISDKTLVDFAATYEEPLFEDTRGKDKATDWIARWAVDEESSSKWIVVLGEYGTGKTALTRIVQLRMLENYLSSKDQPIPVRIELRDFTRQFDARTLLHNFLDRNGLGHISIDFIFHLIRIGRIVLLLDGYDEMAQFLNVRERRACLGALADLASEGAKGILTSRPNYFSEEEELHVFEALYQNIQSSGYYISKSDADYLESEKQIDQLLGRYVLEKFERYLRDLDEDQTVSLVRRRLAHDPPGQEVIISILRKIFREREPGVQTSLSGKPVIITYMLDLVENIKQGVGVNIDMLTEWSAYKLIVDQLMLRDQQRTPGIYPSKRRSCLQKLAISLSQRDLPVAYDELFHKVIDADFKSELRFLDPDQAIVKRNELFENLRSSSTLTRTEGATTNGWVFSHNSLREYLVLEVYVISAREGKFREVGAPISEAMRSFAAAIDSEGMRSVVHNLSVIWDERAEKRGIGSYLTLFWDAFSKLALHDGVPLRKLLPSASGSLAFDAIRIKSIGFQAAGGGDYSNSLFNNSDISEVNFKDINLSNSNFSESFLDAVIFSKCDLSKCSFASSWLFECDIIDCNLSGADFRNLSEDPAIYVNLNGKRTAISGSEALGFLAFNGALVDNVNDYFIFKNHPKFDILLKICEKLIEQKNRQELGLVHKGASRKDIPLAHSFLLLLVRNKWVDQARDLVSITADGRGVLRNFVEQQNMPKEFADFLRAN